MHFKEIIIQGVFGVARGVRLPLGPGLCEPLLPPPLDAAKFKSIVALLLYPRDALASGGVRVDTRVDHPVRLGAVLDVGGVEHKLVWDLKEDTLQVVSASGMTVATGRDEAQALWQRELGLLPWRFFGAVHHHEFFTELPSGGEAADKTTELIEEYRRSLSIEQLENRVVSVEGQLQDLEHSSDPAVQLEVALDKLLQRLKHFEKLPQLDERDAEFLDGYDERARATESELADVIATQQRNEQTLARSRPTPLLRDRLFWLGVVLGAGCMVAAGILAARDPRLRAIALGNAIGFGLALVAALRRMRQHDRHLRIEASTAQLDARRTDLEKTLERESLRLKRLKQRFEAHSADQILSDVSERDKLVERRRELEQRLKEHLADPVFIARRAEIKRLREHLAELRKRRDELGDFVTPTYELRTALEARGIPVETLLPLDASAEAPLVECARELGLVPADAQTLEPLDLPFFNSHLAAVVSKPQPKVSLRDGAVVVSAESSPPTPLRELDARRQAPWLRAMALGLLTVYPRARPTGRDHASLLVLADPWGGLQRNERVRFYSLLKDLARNNQVVLPKVGE